MPANNSGSVFRQLHADHPGQLGWLVSPGGWRTPPDGLPVALDNLAYVSFIKGTPWCGLRFTMHLRSVKLKGVTPIWVVVPDVVADKEKTLASWAHWAPKIRAEFGWPLAFAVQNGMDALDVPADADVVFVGGTTEWKWGTLRRWCRDFPRVHCARVNTRRQLLFAHMCGAESVDGTGFFRGDQAQLAGLKRFLRFENKPIPESEGAR